MIDDLDRCEPEAAFRLLEGLKLYLNLPNCVFVLGMNQKTLEVAIGEAGPEKGTVRQARWAAAYLDKMCQVVWRLPLVRDRKTRLVEWLPVPADSRIRRLLANDDLVDDDCLPPNPRRLKAFANVLPRFEARIDAAPGSPAERVQFRMALVVAYICWRGALRRRYLAVGLAMVLGGAAGNLVDRLARGHVVDFIKLHAGSFAWPDFNVADIGVTVGALLVAGYLYFGLPHDQPAEDTESDRWDDADDADAQSALVECAGSSEDSLETAGPGPSAPTAGHAEPSTPCPASD